MYHKWITKIYQYCTELTQKRKENGDVEIQSPLLPTNMEGIGWACGISSAPEILLITLDMKELYMYKQDSYIN